MKRRKEQENIHQTFRSTTDKVANKISASHRQMKSEPENILSTSREKFRGVFKLIYALVATSVDSCSVTF
ncbi:CLUMA_CG005377, isoform A [Clunio marinus]|uniref:CLUMA_CG005377, isoform A n=1 Tax=Clunio marinus TaxID=568069 RepID=A0A1J1HUK0_9DIPT|nr:CLUMA_CG005377, isoform A [Clunio marinus]